jgi:hypothetical protein
MTRHSIVHTPERPCRRKGRKGRLWVWVLYIFSYFPIVIIHSYKRGGPTGSTASDLWPLASASESSQRLLSRSTSSASHCMPPRKSVSKPLPGPATPSKRTELVAVGSRQVQVKHPTRLDENGLLPSTARALVLRNGKQGAMGTGELMSLRKPIGREKLELLGGKLFSHGIKLIEYPAFSLKRGPPRTVDQECPCRSVQH